MQCFGRIIFIVWKYQLDQVLSDVLKQVLHFSLLHINVGLRRKYCQPCPFWAVRISILYFSLLLSVTSILSHIILYMKCIIQKLALYFVLCLWLFDLHFLVYETQFRGIAPLIWVSVKNLSWKCVNIFLMFKLLKFIFFHNLCF